MKIVLYEYGITIIIIIIIIIRYVLSGCYFFYYRFVQVGLEIFLIAHSSTVV